MSRFIFLIFFVVIMGGHVFAQSTSGVDKNTDRP